MTKTFHWASLLLATFKLPFHPFCFFTSSCSCCPFQKGDNAFHRGVEGEASSLETCKRIVSVWELGRRSCVNKRMDMSGRPIRSRVTRKEFVVGVIGGFCHTRHCPVPVGYFSKSWNAAWGLAILVRPSLTADIVSLWKNMQPFGYSLRKRRGREGALMSRKARMRLAPTCESAVCIEEAQPEGKVPRHSPAVRSVIQQGSTFLRWPEHYVWRSTRRALRMVSSILI